MALFLRKYVRYYEDVVEAEDDDKASDVFMLDALEVVVDTGFLVESVVEISKEELEWVLLFG